MSRSPMPASVVLAAPTIMQPVDQASTGGSDPSPAPAQSGPGGAELLLLGSVVFGVAAWLLFRSPNVAEPDCLYHFTHARIYAQRGIFDQSFPWTAFSATGAHEGDLWWGLHVFAVPFSLIPDPVVGVKVASSAALALGATFLYWAGWRHFGRWAILAPAFTLISGAMELNRLITLRPQTISMGLFALLISFLCRGTWVQALAAAWAVTFIHQTLSWVVPPLVALVLLARVVIERRWDYKAPAAAVAGVLGGWLARPGAVDTAKLMKIQVFDLGRVKSAGVPLPFGTELRHLEWRELVSIFGVFASLWAIAIVVAAAWLARRPLGTRGGETSFMLACAVGSVAFLGLTMFVSLRGLELWVPLASLVLAGAAYAAAQMWPSKRRFLVPATLLLAGAFLAVDTISKNGRYMASRGVAVRRLEPAMRWARENSPRGSVLASVHWDFFGEYFFWNQHNRYLEGFDPIFLYRQNRELYWKLHRLRKRGPAPVPEAWTVFGRDIGANLVLVAKRPTPHLMTELASDKRFEKGYEDRFFAVFRVLPDGVVQRAGAL